MAFRACRQTDQRHRRLRRQDSLRFTAGLGAISPTHERSARLERHALRVAMLRVAIAATELPLLRERAMPCTSRCMRSVTTDTCLCRTAARVVTRGAPKLR